MERKDEARGILPRRNKSITFNSLTVFKSRVFMRLNDTQYRSCHGIVMSSVSVFHHRFFSILIITQLSFVGSNPLQHVLKRLNAVSVLATIPDVI